MIAQRKLDFPLTEPVSPLLLPRGKTKICVLLLMLLSAIFSVRCFALDLTLNKALGGCVVLRSTKVPAAVFQDFFETVNSRFDGQCRVMGVLIDEPFSEVNKSLFLTEDRVGFWVDMEANGSSLLVSGIDCNSRTFWDQLRVALPTVKSLALEQISAAIVQLLDNFTYRGVVVSGGFYLWNGTSAPLALVKRSEISRHPFLPKWLGAPLGDQVVLKSLALSRSGNNPAVLKGSAESNLADQKELWVVADDDK